MGLVIGEDVFFRENAAVFNHKIKSKGIVIYHGVPP